jgi:hypothetical protein
MKEKYDIIEIMTKFQKSTRKNEMWDLAQELRIRYGLPVDWTPRERMEETPLKQIRKYLILTIQEVWLKDTNRVTKTREENKCMIMDLREIV